jgi:hypothetical protein
MEETTITPEGGLGEGLGTLGGVGSVSALLITCLDSESYAFLHPLAWVMTPL